MLLLGVLVTGACSGLSLWAGEPTLPRPPCSDAVARVQRYKPSRYETLTVQDVLNRAATTIHTRLPVYEATLDNIVGILHLQDLFK